MKKKAVGVLFLSLVVITGWAFSGRQTKTGTVTVYNHQSHAIYIWVDDEESYRDVILVTNGYCQLRLAVGSHVITAKKADKTVIKSRTFKVEENKSYDMDV